MKADSDNLCDNEECGIEHTHTCLRRDGHFGDHICQDCDHEWPKQYRRLKLLNGG